MRFEDWIRQHVTLDRLEKVEATLRENGLHPPSELFDFSKFGLIEPVYRIHHSSYKALAALDSMVTTCLEQLLYLFFGETDGRGGGGTLMPLIRDISTAVAAHTA